MRDDAFESISVPERVWALPQMQSALQARRAGEILRLVTKYTGVSQTRIANLSGLSQAEVSRIASGERKVSAIDIFERLADAFQMPDSARMRMGLAPRSLQPEAAAPEPWELVDALTRSMISIETASQLERAALSLSARYPHTTPEAMLPEVARQMQRLRSSLAQPQSLRVRRQCIQIVGVLSGLAGNLHLDLGDAQRATAFFDAGKIASHEAEDDALASWLLATESIEPFFSDRYADAAALLEHAKARAHHEASARRRAWISALLARAQAANGNHPEALRSLADAHALLETADVPTGSDFFDTARLNGIAGTCHLLLGDASEASSLLAESIERRAPGDAKGRALLTLDLAECRILEGEAEEACQLTDRALDLAGAAIVRPIVDRVGALRNKLAPWDNIAAVVAIDERLREVRASL